MTPGNIAASERLRNQDKLSVTIFYLRLVGVKKVNSSLRRNTLHNFLFHWPIANFPVNVLEHRKRASVSSWFWRLRNLRLTVKLWNVVLTRWSRHWPRLTHWTAHPQTTQPSHDQPLGWSTPRTAWPSDGSPIERSNPQTIHSSKSLPLGFLTHRMTHPSDDKHLGQSTWVWELSGGKNSLWPLRCCLEFPESRSSHGQVREGTWPQP